MSAHPYVPTDLVLPSYVPNQDGLEVILGSFFSVCAAVGVITITAAWRSKHLSTAERLIVCWMTLCAGIHFFLEGYYSVYNRSFLGKQDILAQICAHPQFPAQHSFR